MYESSSVDYIVSRVHLEKEKNNYNKKQTSKPTILTLSENYCKKLVHNFFKVHINQH